MICTWHSAVAQPASKQCLCPPCQLYEIRHIHKSAAYIQLAICHRDTPKQAECILLQTSDDTTKHDPASHILITLVVGRHCNTQTESMRQPASLSGIEHTCLTGGCAQATGSYATNRDRRSACPMECPCTGCDRLFSSCLLQCTFHAGGHGATSPRP